jgi:hypothetical protein
MMKSYGCNLLLWISSLATLNSDKSRYPQLTFNIVP